MKILKVLLLIVVVSMSVSISHGANAYELSGGSWNSVDDLLYDIDTSISTRSQDLWDSAVTDWNGSTTDVDLTEDSSEDIWLTAVQSSSFSWDGYAIRLPHSAANPYTRAVLELNQYFTDNHSSYTYSYNKARSVANHEFGHAFGLAHETGGVLMNDTTATRYDTYGVYTDTADDQNGVNYLY